MQRYAFFSLQVTNYDNQTWGANGPTRLSESVNDYCDNFAKPLPIGAYGQRKSGLKITPCLKNEVFQFDVLSPHFISLVHWNDVDKMFTPLATGGKHGNNDIDLELKKRGSIGVHFYNKITEPYWKYGDRHRDDPNIPYKQIFRANCPLTYKDWYSQSLLTVNICMLSSYLIVNKMIYLIYIL